MTGGIRCSLAAGALAVLAPLPGAAEPPAALGPHRVEVAGNYQQVTESFGDWKGLLARVIYPVGNADVLYLDAARQEAFGDDGVYAALADAHTWSDQWSTLVGAGTGSGEFFFPRLRADASVTRRWPPAGRVMTTAGLTYVRAQDEHRDWALTLVLAAYVGERVIAEIGGRLNRSDPGQVWSGRGFGNVVVGSAGARQVTLRGGAGTEGYQLTGDDEVIRDFFSWEASLSWREWVAGGWGVVAAAEFYDNPYYTRTGGSLGVFYEW